jgi:hypothetical protein
VFLLSLRAGLENDFFIEPFLNSLEDAFGLISTIQNKLIYLHFTGNMILFAAAPLTKFSRKEFRFSLSALLLMLLSI